MNRFDEAVTAAEAKHREAMRAGSDQLREAITAARENRAIGSPQYVFWGMM